MKKTHKELTNINLLFYVINYTLKYINFMILLIKGDVMKSLINIALKSMKKNKKRTLVTIIAITLSSCLMFLTCFIFSIYYKDCIKNAIYKNGFQEVIINNITYKDFKTIKSDDIKNIYPVIIENLKTESQGNIKIIKTNEEFIKNYNLMSGQYPNNNSQLITNRNNCLNYSDISYENYKIVGCIDSKYYDSNIYFYTIDNFNDDDVISVYINYKEIKNVREKTLKIANNFKDATITYNDNLLELYNESTSNIGAVKYAVLIVCIIISATIIGLFSLLIIYTSYSISVIERKKMYGVLNSIGCTKFQIVKIVAFEALIEFIISIILGFLISFIIATIGTNIINNNLLTNYEITIYPIYLIICIIILLVFVSLSSIMPAIEASYISPIQSIMGHNDIKRKKIKSNKLINKLFKIEGEISLKNIKRNKRKYTITIVSLVLSFSIFVTFSIFIDLINDTSDYSISIELGNYDYEIFYKDDNIDEFVDEVKKLNINEINVLKKQSLNIKSINKYYKDEVFKSPTEDKYGSSIDLINIYNFEPNKPQFINEVFMYQTINDKIEIYEGLLLKNNEIQIDICNRNDSFELVDCTTIKDIDIKNERILGMDNMNTSNSLIVNAKTYNELVNKYSTNGYSPYYIYIKTDNITKFEQNLLNLKSNYNFSSKNEKLESIQLTKEYKIISTIAYSFLTFIILFSLINAYNSISTTINLRKKEFNMLKSIGMNSFNKMLILESIFFSFKTIIWGTSLSLLIYFWLKLIFEELFSLQKIINDNSFYFPLPLKYILLASIALIFIIYIFIKISFNKINKENIADSLKENLF